MNSTTRNGDARLATRLGLRADSNAETILAAFDRAITARAAASESGSDALYRAAWGDDEASEQVQPFTRPESPSDDLYDAAWGARDAVAGGDRFPKGGTR